MYLGRLGTDCRVQPCSKGLGILVENNLDLCQQCSPAAATPTSHGIVLASGQQVQGCGHSLLPGSGEAASAILCAVFKHTSPIVWEMLTAGEAPTQLQDQQEHVLSEEMRWELGGFGLQKGRLGDLTEEMLLQEWDKNSNASKLFLQVHSERTRCNGLILPSAKSFLNKGSSSFARRMLQPWDRLPTEVVESPSLDFQDTCAQDPGVTLSSFEVSPAWNRRWDFNAHFSLTQLKSLI